MRWLSLHSTVGTLLNSIVNFFSLHIFGYGWYSTNCKIYQRKIVTTSSLINRFVTCTMSLRVCFVMESTNISLTKLAKWRRGKNFGTHFFKCWPKRYKILWLRAARIYCHRDLFTNCLVRWLVSLEKNQITRNTRDAESM